MADDTRTALQQLRQKAATGDVMALNELKVIADEGDGNPEALFQLGMLFDGAFPSTIASNKVIARAFYSRAAQLNHKHAQLCIGNMYDYGEGGDKDLVEARRWYSAAAVQGVKHAQMNYGRMLEKGRGGCEDKEEAAKWYLLAAEQGDDFAATNLASMHISGELHDSNPEFAVKLLQFSAEKLDGIAHLHLGNIYVDGVAGEFDGRRALNHYCIAALLLPPGTNKDIAVARRDAMLDQHPDQRIKFEELALAYISDRQGHLLS